MVERQPHAVRVVEGVRTPLASTEFDRLSSGLGAVRSVFDRVVVAAGFLVFAVAASKRPRFPAAESAGGANDALRVSVVSRGIAGAVPNDQVRIRAEQSDGSFVMKLTEPASPSLP